MATALLREINSELFLRGISRSGNWVAIRNPASVDGITDAANWPVKLPDFAVGAKTVISVIGDGTANGLRGVVYSGEPRDQIIDRVLEACEEQGIRPKLFRPNLAQSFVR